MEKHSHKDIESLVWLITDADAVVVGVGSGLSSADLTITTGLLH